MDREMNTFNRHHGDTWQHPNCRKHQKEKKEFSEVEGKTSRLISRLTENSKMDHAVTVINFMWIPV